MTVKIDMADLTLRELADVGDALAPVSLVDAIQGPAQARAMAALAWVMRRRDDPTFSFDDALDLRMGDLELVNAEQVPPADLVPGANDGATPRLSLESGASTRSA